MVSRMHQPFTQIVLALLDVNWPNTVTAGFAIISAVVAGGGVTYKAIQKVRENARKAKEAEEAEIKKRVDEAVASTKKEMQASIDMNEKVATHWQRMATIFEKEKEQAEERFGGEIERLREERDKALKKVTELSDKVEEVVDLNLGYQGQVKELMKSHDHNKAEIADLKDQVQQLEKALNRHHPEEK